MKQSMIKLSCDYIIFYCVILTVMFRDVVQAVGPA